MTQELNWVSVNKTRQSVALSASMKRLTWITVSHPSSLAFSLPKTPSTNQGSSLSFFPSHLWRYVLTCVILLVHCLGISADVRLHETCFGMNIDILASNPAWWIYVASATGTVLLTSTVWIAFKYSNVRAISRSLVSDTGSDIDKITVRTSHRRYGAATVYAGEEIWRLFRVSSVD